MLRTLTVESEGTTRLDVISDTPGVGEPFTPGVIGVGSGEGGCVGDGLGEATITWLMTGGVFGLAAWVRRRVPPAVTTTTVAIMAGICQLGAGFDSRL